MKSIILIIIILIILVVIISTIMSYIKLDITRYNIKSNKIDKIIQSGNINKDAWLQLSKMFITQPNKESYTGDR